MGRLAGRALPSRLGKPPSRLRKPQAKAEDQSRRSQDWLNTARWQRLRLKILRRDAVDLIDQPHLMPFDRVLFANMPTLWPVCQQTGEALTGEYPAPNSPVVDHKTPHRGDPDLFWDEKNLQSVSKAWHDRTKQSMERRGLA